MITNQDNSRVHNSNRLKADRLVEIRSLASLKRPDGDYIFTVSEISHLVGQNYRTVWKHAVSARKGVDYTSDWLKKNGFSSHHRYREFLLLREGITPKEYDKEWAISQGFDSWEDHRRTYIANEMLGTSIRKNISRSANKNRDGAKKLLQILIEQRLGAIKRDQKWLSRKTGLTDSGISRIANAQRVPRGKNQPLMFGALELPFKNLDELLDTISANIFHSANHVGSYEAFDQKFNLYKCKMCPSIKTKQGIVKHYVRNHLNQYLFS